MLLKRAIWIMCLSHLCNFMPNLFIEHWEDFFEPLLPAKRLAIFKSIGYGSMAKVNHTIFF